MVDMDLFEPITMDNISELEPGEWIWDNHMVSRREHRKCFGEEIIEPTGFRQIDILDLDLFPRWSSRPFMLSSIDHRHGATWTRFENNRFYKFKRTFKEEK